MDSENFAVVVVDEKGRPQEVAVCGASERYCRATVAAMMETGDMRVTHIVPMRHACAWRLEHTHLTEQIRSQTPTGARKGR